MAGSAAAGGLPALREDLVLVEAATQRDGSPAWMIHDPVVNRFYRIGWLEFELLSRWSIGSPDAIRAVTLAETGLDVDPAELTQLVDFLARHHLLRASEASASRALVAEAERSRRARFRRLLHDYLFFRVPIVQPQAWLERWLPAVRFVASAPFLWLTAVATGAGVLLALRQWDVFVQSLQASFSPRGLVGYALALALAKALHELGHAFTATHYRVRVAHMGVAFLVLWPMLYTDTGEAWKLADRRQRFAIAAAGMAVELGLAGFATLAWSLAPDGAVRDALFFLATVSWIMTLAINASPFMRFDGYFLLSDAMDLPNLHQRAFDQARLALRRFILGASRLEAAQDSFEPGARRALILFAWATWAWRFVVFLGIALAVYHFFFKALGIVLFAVEIAWFIVRPVASEVGHWIALRRQAQAGHIARSLLVLIAVLAVLALPWRGAVRAEGYLHAVRAQVLYTPVAARLALPIDSGERPLGQTLVTLDSPDTRQRLSEHQATAQALERQLHLSVGSSQGLERRAQLAERLQGEMAALAGERAQLARLTLVAPFNGRLVDLDENLVAGSWVAPGQPIAVFVDPTAWVVDAFVSQEDLARIPLGARARFYRYGPGNEVLDGVVIGFDQDRQQRFAHPMLAVDHGGRLAAQRGPDGRLIPREALYRVRVRIGEDSAAGRAAGQGSVMTPASQREAIGAVHLQAEPRSLLLDWGRHALSVLIRESSF